MVLLFFDCLKTSNPERHSSSVILFLYVYIIITFDFFIHLVHLVTRFLYVILLIQCLNLDEINLDQFTPNTTSLLNFFAFSRPACFIMKFWFQFRQYSQYGRVLQLFYLNHYILYISCSIVQLSCFENYTLYTQIKFVIAASNVRYF